MQYNNIINRNRPMMQKQQVNTNQQMPKKCDYATLRKIREALIGELEAINQYEQIMMEINDEKTIAVLNDIRNEEVIHTGMLMANINYLCENQAELEEIGRQEFAEIIQKS